MSCHESKVLSKCYSYLFRKKQPPRRDQPHQMRPVDAPAGGHFEPVGNRGAGPLPVSCPGMTSTRISGRPHASASETVSPPALLRMQSAALTKIPSQLQNWVPPKENLAFRAVIGIIFKLPMARRSQKSRGSLTTACICWSP